MLERLLSSIFSSKTLLIGPVLIFHGFSFPILLEKNKLFHTDKNKYEVPVEIFLSRQL